MTTLEDIFEAFALAYDAVLQVPPELREYDEPVDKTALRAILRIHIEPMIAEAYEAGLLDGAGCADMEGASLFARRKIEEVIGK